MKFFSKRNFVINSETSASIWDQSGLSVRPECREGDAEITTLILKTILQDGVREYFCKRYFLLATNKDYTPQLPSFLLTMDRIFRSGASFELMEANRYDDVVQLWEPVVSDSCFDLNCSFYRANSYYRTLILSALCWTVTAQLKRLEMEMLSGDTSGRGFVHSLHLIEMLVEAQPFRPDNDFYYQRDRLLCDIQNSNIWNCLDFLGRWFKVWSVVLFEVCSESTNSQRGELMGKIRQAERRFNRAITPAN